MFCKYCGSMLNDDDKFCPNCGGKIETNVCEEKAHEVVATEEKKPAKIWFIFGKIARILSIISIATCWIYGIVLAVNGGAIFESLGVVSIVLALLSRKSKDQEVIETSKKTVVRAVWSIAISVGIAIVIGILINVFGLFNNYFENIINNFLNGIFSDILNDITNQITI